MGRLLEKPKPPASNPGGTPSDAAHVSRPPGPPLFFPKSVSMNKNLRIFRTFEDGRRVPVGHAENRNGNIVFRYDGEYLAAFGEAVGSLSPLTLPYDASLQPTPDKCPAGLPGFLAESLPDGYGLWLMDKAFQRRGVPR